MLAQVMTRLNYVSTAMYQTALATPSSRFMEVPGPKMTALRTCIGPGPGTRQADGFRIGLPPGSAT